MKRLLVAAVSSGALALLSSCQPEGCLADTAGCKVPAPCPKVAFTCSAAGSTLSVKALDAVSQRPGGWDGLGTVGDVKLRNDLVEVVISQIGSQNYLDPNGGSILDITPAGQAKDVVNNIFQVVGVLPGDAVHYTSLEIIDERPARDAVAVQVRGALDGRPSVKVSTRYELTPCDPGVRVRTEIFNGSTDTELWSLVDAYYWSGREALPFAPGVFVKDGASFSGFAYPSFGLTTINDVYRPMPYLAAAGHSGDDHISSISSTSCTTAPLEGFNSDVISAAGLKRAVVPPRGFEVFERFIASADTKGVSGAVDTALAIRKQVLGEQLVSVTGLVERPRGAIRGEREASVLVTEGTLATPAAQRNQWTQVVPLSDGSFSARVPAGKPLVVSVSAFGQTKVEREFAALTADTALGAFVLPDTATVTFTVTDGANPVDAEVFVVPTDDGGKALLQGSLHGRFTTCSPWLGAPPGASPACNRVLVRAGQAIADLPLGSYFIYGFKGPFWSLDRQEVTVSADRTVALTVKRLGGLQPAGTVGADLHVHGAASFDSSIPDFDRVLSFSASDLEVIIATDHEVVHDYADVIQQLGLSTVMSAVTGVETTGHIPFFYIPGYGFPLVIGHYNLWPLRYDPSKLRNGAPQDELVEPGMLFKRAEPLFATSLPIIELNHPWADPEFGRDLGFPRALSLDIRKDLPAGTTDDGTSGGMYVRVPAGATLPNDGHHAQEVMNGSENAQYLQYRAFWFYVLNQGRLKTGTANSDSHSLVDSTVGLPRNLVTAATHGGTGFSVDALNQAIREGKVLGTNGPVIEATVEAAAGGSRGWSLAPFQPRAGAKVKVKVTAAPWVPVEEVRFVVNGVVVKTVGSLPVPPDPRGTEPGAPRYDAEVALSDLLTGVTGDAWLVIEAGARLPVFGDLGGGLDGKQDGIPDTTDNNGDGVVNAADVAAGQKIGPLKDLPLPTVGQPGFDFGNLTGGHPVGFTNPFVLDVNGDGVFTAPGVKGGRP